LSTNFRIVSGSCSHGATVVCPRDEAGDYLDDADFDGAELDGYARLYPGAAAMATVDQSVDLYAGACLGGGTVVNFSTCFPTPDDVQAEWARLGVAAMIS
jgi:hypothetical protein